MGKWAYTNFIEIAAVMHGTPEVPRASYSGEIYNEDCCGKCDQSQSIFAAISTVTVRGGSQK